MATILVVDDSSIDRKLVAGLLEPVSDFEVRFANDGEEAIASLQESLPDAVVTDLVMPKIDGLELVRTVRDQFPTVPTILMTSQGNETIAVQALESGAASYVPKRELPFELVDTLTHILALCTQQRTQERLMSGLVRTSSAFWIPNDAALITRLVGRLQDNVTHMGICDEAERIRFGVAIEEALVNAMYHGNLELDSSIKEEDHEAYDALVRERRQIAPYCERKITVETNLSQEEAVVVIGDEGPGFDPNDLPDPTDPENLDRITGRGVLLMRTFMDDIQYNENGSRVTMTKRRSSESNGAT